MSSARPTRQALAIAFGTTIVAIGIHLARDVLSSPPPDALLFLGRFHPLAVHMPIGVLLLAVLMEGASVVERFRARLDEAVAFVLAALVATALAGFILGHFLALEGGYPSRLLALHRACALFTVVGAGVALVAWMWARERRHRLARVGYRVALAVTVVALSTGAHFGGSMTHGDAWLVRYAPSFMQSVLGRQATSTATPPPLGDEPLVFRDVIQPLLRSRCGECHGTGQSKGGLRLDSLEAMTRGGDGGPGLLPRDGTGSRIVARMMMPEGNDERMPPDGHERLTPGEIDLVRWWIDRGAVETLRVRDTLAPPSNRTALARVNETASPVVATEIPSAAPPPASPAASVAASSRSPGSPSAPPSNIGSSIARDGLIYRDLLAPFFASRCSSCHSEAKQKGKLRLDSVAAMLRGGVNGPAVVPGSAAQSLVLRRTRLAAEDDLHMPPMRSPQPSPDELDALAWWIDAGADEGLTTSALPKSIRRALSPASLPGKPPGNGAGESPGPNPSEGVATNQPSGLPIGDIDLYAVARSVLDRRCVSCHSDGGPAGKLSLETFASIARGGKSGPALIPGRQTASAMIRRMELPLGNPKHMPQSDEPQPVAAEVEALRIWIEHGASETSVLPRALASRVMISNLEVALSPPAAAPALEQETNDGATPVGPEHASSAAKRPPAATPGGCASCAIGSTSSSTVSLLCALLGFVGWFARRRGRRMK